ncbi:MAG: RdgB/HAM1 family non-canonical purine NTP pyrophosphatase [Methylobacter sp.]|nr:RdgB/HAM1 family non-canonical purine NTP pyrophosphatase [Methylobacter sp.]MDP2099745.1 RdgB/HAM1 family non-canonical purine NTP pyrophosphatase [Methylobacter sp.]MDP2430379.1 RdgB/HAM1 family non-canonical purine NTP pyrophosphatase [Methylobacter sp.]MDP3053547.1 RdgB/HAM1 family non-canonical purine NTP pyrophosphatase [Methylobacter sp.]MDP3362726.1 RdgB/HAM1 family non-canonical purine NTP pyrophosphatase [Methylobacter sp.]
MSFAALNKIVLASSNPGKIREIQALLAAHPIVAQSEFNVLDAEETGSTFVENAILKARNAALHCRLPAIADDSGLVVDALNGAPGVISARYAGIGASDRDNVDKLLRELDGVPDAQRTARFICVVVFMTDAQDPCPVIAQGVWEGRILDHTVGENGFGYDPVFWLPSHDCTSAQLPAEVKNALSHRGQALKTLTALIAAKESA